MAEDIRGQMATGVLRPGDALPPESSLIEEFDVARPTIREALRILESDGLVTVRRGASGGARVREPDVNSLARRAGLHLQIRGAQIGDLMTALRVIQPGAVALAATAATPAQLAELRAQIEKVAACTSADTFADEATQFSNVLMQASGNDALAFLSTLLNRLVRVEADEYMNESTDGRSTVDDEFRGWCVDQYERLVDLIEAGQADKAEELWRTHLQLVARDVDETLALAVYRRGSRRTRRAG